MYFFYFLIFIFYIYVKKKNRFLFYFKIDVKWTVHKRPRNNIKLAMLPMTLIKQSRTRSKTQTATTLKIEHQTEIAMLLTAEDGSVWSRSGTSKKYRWERQRRAPARVASAPSNTIILPHTVSVFFIGRDGTLMERRYRTSSSRWLWTDYGHPPNLPLTTARPMVMSVTNVLCQTIDGSTASLTKWNGVWQWVIHRGPEMKMDPEVARIWGGEDSQLYGNDLSKRHHSDRYEKDGRR